MQGLHFFHKASSVQSHTRSLPHSVSVHSRTHPAPHVAYPSIAAVSAYDGRAYPQRSQLLHFMFRMLLIAASSFWSSGASHSICSRRASMCTGHADAARYDASQSLDGLKMTQLCTSHANGPLQYPESKLALCL